MKILHETPPNFEKIVKVFPSATQKGVIFTYGDIIYAPSGGAISLPLMVHERVHSDRQRDNVEGWWDSYLTNVDFRLEEELAAHIAEYQMYGNVSRNERRMAFKAIAERLASPLYGNMLTKEKAKQLIKEGYYG